MDKDSPPAFVFIDVDGYAPGGIDQRTVVGPSRDGYRPRELGWMIFNSEACTSGSFYFTDRGIQGLPKLSIHDSGVRHVLTKVHGLPLGDYQQPVPPELLYRSDQLLGVIAGLCEAAAVGGHTAIVVHKGGNEGIWTEMARPGTPSVNLADYGCPKVDRIAKEHPDWLARTPGPCKHHEVQVRGGRRKGVIHCPALELALLAQWVATGEALDAV